MEKTIEVSKTDLLKFIHNQDEYRTFYITLHEKCIINFKHIRVRNHKQNRPQFNKKHVLREMSFE
jgi:hypothetical protein